MAEKDYLAGLSRSAQSEKASLSRHLCSDKKASLSRPTKPRQVILLNHDILTWIEMIDTINT